MRIVETENARFIAHGEISGSTVPREGEVRVQVPLACASNSKVITHLVIVPKKNNEEEQHNNESTIHNELIVEKLHEVALKRSQEKGDQLFRITMWYTYMKQK